MDPCIPPKIRTDSAVYGSLHPSSKIQLDLAVRGIQQPLFRNWTDSAVRRSLHPTLKIRTDSAVRGSLHPALISHLFSFFTEPSIDLFFQIGKNWVPLSFFISGGNVSLLENLLWPILENSKIQDACKSVFMHLVKLKLVVFIFVLVNFIFRSSRHFKSCIWYYFNENEWFFHCRPIRGDYRERRLV